MHSDQLRRRSTAIASSSSSIINPNPRAGAVEFRVMQARRGMDNLNLWRQEQEQQPPPVFQVPKNNLSNHHTPQLNAAAQEVCVIQRTAGAASLINFGGLEGGIVVKHQQQQQHNNQLLALVQQQQQRPPNVAALLQQEQVQLHQELYTAPPLPVVTRSLPRTSSSSSCFVDALPRVSSFGRVSTLDIHGLSVSGELLLTDKGAHSDVRLEIVCSCHASHMSVSRFVQHVNAAASHPINTGSVVFMENGQNLLHWRKSLFAKLGVKIDDDDAGWDWNDQTGCDTTVTDAAYANYQPTRIPLPPATLNYHLQAIHRRPHPRGDHFPGALRSTDFVNPSNSEYFDFISRGGNRAYTPASTDQQHLGVGEKFRRTDPGLNDLRPDVSSIELRLGQPSQQAHKAGKPFDAAHYQIQECAALGPNNHQDFGLQFSQQQRLEKVNVLNFNQCFGSAALERTVLSCEQTKLWAETIQNETTGVSSDTFAAAVQVKPQAPEYPLQQIIKRVSTARHFNNISAGLSQIDLSYTNSAQRQHVSHESSQTTWTLGTPLAARPQSGFTEEGVFHLGTDVFQARGLGSMPGGTYRQHQHPVDLTGSVPGPDRDTLRVRNNSSCVKSTDNSGTKLVFTDANSTLEKHPFALQEATRPTNGVQVLNSAREDGVRMPLGNDIHRIKNAYPAGQVLDPVMPASSGVLVSVGENEFPVTRCDFERTISAPGSQHFEPLKSFRLDVPEQEEVKEDGEKSAATNDGKQTCLTQAVLSEVSTKSSENVLSGFSDDRHVNEEASTLESESQKQDIVDAGSGIDNEQDKTTSGDPRDSSAKGELSINASGSSEKLQASAEVEAEEGLSQEATVNRKRKKQSMKWKSVNSTYTPNALSDSEATNRNQTPRQPRTARSIRDRCKSFETVEQGGKACQTPRRGHPSSTGSGKIMSLKSIMENSAGRKTGVLQDGAAVPKQTRKRKLSELSTQAFKGGPFSTSIPRGERSPRKGGVTRDRAAAKEQKMNEASVLPKRKRESQTFESGQAGAAERKSAKNQQPPSTNSCADEATVKVKWKSLQNDSFDACPKNECTRKTKLQSPSGCKSQDSCSVCGSWTTEPHNQLVHCISCSIQVHQACYGVPKVPKASWTCRPCKSNSDNAVCVLCGYGGGAMTRAQKAVAAGKDLLRVWNAARAKASRGLRRSSRNMTTGDGGAQEEISNNSVTASLADSSVAQWTHMVCALWMPGTRCLNLETMGAFDVSGVSAARRRLTCSICKRQGGSCIQCHEPKCAVPFHAWCAHNKGLLQIETVNDTDGHVRFHGNCTAHHTMQCARTQEYKKPVRY